MESQKEHRKLFILYCSLAGFISAWAISGLLVIVDIISGAPAGTFFAVIGISLGFSDPVTAQYVGFVLHVITGMAAVMYLDKFHYFGQSRTLRCKSRIGQRMIVGIALWQVLFVPLATLGIQPSLIHTRSPHPTSMFTI